VSALLQEIAISSVDVAPWVIVKAYDPASDSAVERPASSLSIGDLVWTRPECGGEYNWFMVTQVSSQRSLGHRLMLQDGRTVEVGNRHRFYTDGNWIQAQLLRRGDILIGERPGIVESVEPIDEIDTTQIIVSGAHTFQANGMLSHDTENTRQPTGRDVLV